MQMSKVPIISGYAKPVNCRLQMMFVKKKATMNITIKGKIQQS
jgi:hypothetical protein